MGDLHSLYIYLRTIFYHAQGGYKDTPQILGINCIRGKG